MARGVQIALTLNPADFIRGLRRIELGTEDVVDALDDIEKADVEIDTGGAERDLGRIEDAATAAGAEVESELDAGARAAEDSFGRLRRDVGREFDRMERDARDADLDVSEGIRGAEGSAKQAAGLLAGEVVQEFTENWGEAVRSGDYAGAVRETLSQLGQVGGALAGPAGAVVGGALALGLTTAFDKVMGTSQEKARIRDAINEIFLEVTDEASEAGGTSWVAYRDAVVAAARSDKAIADALGVESFAEAAQLIAEAGEAAGQPWEDDLMVALTDPGPAGEQAAQRVRAAWEESNASIAAMEADRDTARANGAQDYANQIQARINQERVANDAMRDGVGWLESQGDIQDGLQEQARNRYRQEALVSAGYRDQALAARGVKDRVDDVADATRRVPDIDIKAKVDKSEIDNIPRTRNITVTAKLQAATAKGQRLLNAGML